MVVRTKIRAGGSCYTVQSGDSLCKIAQMYYGSCSDANVEKIYYSNIATIGPDPAKIYPGEKLYIP